MDGVDPRVAAFFQARGIPVGVHHYPEGTATAEEAAAALGVPIRRIIKTMVFVADGAALVVLCGGDRKVDTDKLGRVVHAKRVRMADRVTAEKASGFPVGGVSPVALARDLPVYADAALLREPVLYAGAGTMTALFSIDPARLMEACLARVIDLSRD